MAYQFSAARPWTTCVRVVTCVHIQAKAALDGVRDAVHANNGYLLGEFSYADITMAVSLLSSTEPLGPPYSP